MLVVSAIEAVTVLAFLLRAEALTEAGRREAFTAARRFFELLMHDEFRSRQKSEWAIYKFHLLFHVTNWLTVRPNLQYIANPGGVKQVDNAVVAGLKIQSTF